MQALILRQTHNSLSLGTLQLLNQVYYCWEQKGADGGAFLACIQQ